MNRLLKLLITVGITMAAVGVLAAEYWQYVINPWTRDGQVRAQVIQITPRVTGPIVKLPIKDNQLVKAGDLFFEIDARTFQADLDKAQADLVGAQVDLDNAKDEAERYTSADKRTAGVVSKEDVETKLNAQRAAAATVKGAQAQLQQAQLNLEFTQVQAPVDGYVTNLNLRLGSQAVADQAALALVDVNSFWVVGYFRETLVAAIHQGDGATVTLMSYPDRPLAGQVESIGWGISQDDGSTGYDLLPSISATFEWIRLAERVPVRIHLHDVPDDVKLRVGTTASVVVMTGTHDADTTGAAPAVPRALQ